MSKTILLGQIGDTTYTLTLDDKNCLLYDSYTDIFDDDEGEEMAREYMDNDTEMWKMAVQADNTILGLDDWNDEVLRYDGWQVVLGQDSIVDIGNDYTYYVRDYDYKSGVGLPDEDFSSYHEIELTEDDFNELIKAYNEDNAEKLQSVFGKYTEFESSQLKSYV